MPLKPDKKKENSLVSWDSEIYRVCKRIQDNARPSCHTIKVTKLNINKYLTIKGIRSKFKQYT